MDSPFHERGDLASQIKPYTIPLVFTCISIGAIVLSFFILYKSLTTPEPIEFIEADRGGGESPQNISHNFITVDVAGAVVSPGVYKVPQDARIDDVISEAGGLAVDASELLLEKVLNRAARVSDGAKVYIPRKSDEDTSHNLVSGGEMSSDQTSHNINSEQTRGAGIISINTASQVQLEELPGVGPVTASKIITGRPYINIQELLSRKVISVSIFERIQGQISL